MRKPSGHFEILLRYFFRRFFENDLIDSIGDTLTTVVRAVSIVAVPGLMVAFFLQNQYPRRSPWGRVEDHLFFVVYSFVTMAGVAIFEWEMLFPDRLDFLVLSHLPLRQRQLLGAKAGALVVFLALFLLGSNIFGWMILPAVGRENFGRHLLAHGVAVLAAGCFGGLAVLAAGGLLLCLLPRRTFQLVSPILRTIVVATLGLILISYLRFGDQLYQILASPLGAARFVPPFWFLGVYERLLRGASAEPFARPMAHIAGSALLIAFSVTAVTYPLAWARMRKMTLEGGASSHRRSAFGAGRLITLVARGAPSRAMLHFIGQTVARTNRYHVYLSTYFGAGAALAVACAVTFTECGAGLRPSLAPQGIYAVIPLLLFWTVAGVRMAFALPVHLPARWIFRLTAAPRAVCVASGRTWAGACSITVLALLLLLLWLVGMSSRALLVQAVCGICLCSVIVDGLLYADGGIPFAQPRSPGKTSLPLTLTLFVGVLPLSCIGVVHVEMWLEHHLIYLLLALLFVPAVHEGARWLRLRFQAEPEDGHEVEEEFQLLGLSAE